MSFRLRGTHFLITWAQAEIDHLDVFNTLDTYAPIERCVLARELHADGQPHFHAFVQFSRRLDRSLTDNWDIDGKHPNVQPKRYRRERQNAAEYLRKGDNWIEYGDWGDPEGDIDESLLDLISQCDDFGAVLNLCHSEGIAFQLAKAAWNYMGSTHPRTWLDGEEKDGEISSRNLRDLDYHEDIPPTSLVLGGRAGVGKTTWAIRNAPRPLLVIKHIEDLLFYRRDFHKALLFDDCSFTHMPRQQQLGIVDREQNVTIHLRHIVARIPEFVPRIFTCNIGHLPVDLSDEAIARRCTYFEC